jgi:carbamoyl-phosphate synthase large subunit
MEQGFTEEVVPNHYSVKEAVFPFLKFPGVDPLLGPEMKSTGEVMGVGASFGEAFAKSQLAAGGPLPPSGRAFISVRDGDKRAIVPVARQLADAGFELVATGGTNETLHAASIACERINKVTEGRPHIVDQIKNDEIDLIINTTEGKQSISDSFSIRREALNHKVTYFTTVAGAEAVAYALSKLEERNNR